LKKEREVYSEFLKTFEEWKQLRKENL
jgi:LPS O-antigen subunit length determinant protein (WzzB/FepE family)